MKTILTVKGSLPTARNIRNEIEATTGERFLIFCDANKAKTAEIRYGNSSPVKGLDLNINSKEFIELSKQKGVFDMFCRANQIYSPIC